MEETARENCNNNETAEQKLREWRRWGCHGFISASKLGNRRDRWIFTLVDLYHYLVFRPCRYEVIVEPEAGFPDPRSLSVFFPYEIPSFNDVISLVHQPGA